MPGALGASHRFVMTLTLERAAGLPPGQRRVAGFPRFGTHLHHPPPAIPAEPAIEFSGPIDGRVAITLPDLAQLPRVERTEDFHCVAGWSATGLRWGGVTFATVHRTFIAPALLPGPPVTHLRFRGYDGYASTVHLEDALADDVLLATHLDGEPLTPAHGAPVRLVSPRQYGYISTKHLAAIELHTTRPRPEHPYAVLTRDHPRARVWAEERNPWIPAAVLRPLYRSLIRPIARVSARGLDERLP